MSFFRMFQHLLPRSRAWTLTYQKTLRSFFEGLSAEPENIRNYVDGVNAEIFPDTTNELAEYEKQFGLSEGPDDASRREAINGAWKSPGGQSPRYIQDVLHESGFTQLFVHDWWSSGPGPYVARDPRNYTNQPLLGTTQARPNTYASQPVCRPRASAFTQYVCNNFQANVSGYLVNKDLTNRGQPPIPDDPKYHPFFIYIGGQTFPDVALIPANRRAELERLLLRICPTHLWIVLLATDGGQIFDQSFGASFN